MFHHQGKNRTLKHNMALASLLAFVAGLVNVAGFLSVQKLTTNVTGHFAYFIDEIFKLQFLNGFIYFLYIFFFFLGSFISSFLVEIVSKRNKNYVFIVPVIFESLILYIITFSGMQFASNCSNVIAFSLLFAMGLQNSLVTVISNAAVRTTHLTGLFTDLGIELSQLFFYKHAKQKQKLVSSIKLRLTIICTFFIGGILGAILYNPLGLAVLSIPATMLILGIYIDSRKW